MDQNQWFNAGSPAPMNDRQAFEAGWTAAQRQMAYTPFGDEAWSFIPYELERLVA